VGGEVLSEGSNIFAHRRRHIDSGDICPAVPGRRYYHQPIHDVNGRRQTQGLAQRIHPQRNHHLRILPIYDCSKPPFYLSRRIFLTLRLQRHLDLSDHIGNQCILGITNDEDLGGTSR
jgi:hypothetical protein